jgi:hypothetical protein
MRLIAYFLLAIGLSTCLGCSSNRSIDGGGTENGSHGHFKIAFPF